MAKKKVARPAKKRPAKKPNLEATKLVIPVGWRSIQFWDPNLDDWEPLKAGDAVWDVGSKAWLTLTSQTEPPWSQIAHQGCFTVIRRIITLPPLPSAETPHALLVLQARMKDALLARQDIELEGKGEKIEGVPLGRQVDAVGNVILTATAIEPDELAEYLAKHPIFGKRHLGYVPPGTDKLTELLFRYYLVRIPEEDRAKLYEIGGMQAVRDMAMRLAKQALKLKQKAQPKRPAKKPARKKR